MFFPVRMRDRSDVLDSYDTASSMMDSLFNDFGTVFGNYSYKNDAGDFVREIECPGFNKQNLSVELSEGVLTISGERKDNEGIERKIYKRFRMGTYEDVDAKIEDGILYLTIKTPKEKKQKIELK
jgi:HSP20 family molecular chaperone IbpA